MCAGAGHHGKLAGCQCQGVRSNGGGFGTPSSIFGVCCMGSCLNGAQLALQGSCIPADVCGGGVRQGGVRAGGGCGAKHDQVRGAA